MIQDVMHGWFNVRQHNNRPRDSAQANLMAQVAKDGQEKSAHVVIRAFALGEKWRNNLHVNYF